MKLTKEQQDVVEKNLGLVGKVIKDKVHDVNHLGIYTYDDIFQIGCIGLSKAAATDKGGCFSTYAYCLIWNEICDALIYATRRMEKEQLLEDDMQYASPQKEFNPEISLDVFGILKQAKENANSSTRKGIVAIELRAEGYSCKEIGERMQAPANLVTAWIAKARKYLKGIPELREAYNGGGWK